MRADAKTRQAMIDTAHLLAERGWVANHDGNLTARLGDNRFLATPTATAKASVSDKNLIEVDGGGQRVAGTARPFGELPLHLAVYRGRDDVRAVVHAHPPYATALACSGKNLIERPFLAEAVVSLGARIPLLPFAAPGPESVEVLEGAVGTVDVVLLANHGVFAWGADLEQAFLRMELVEHLARIATVAEATGGVRPLPEAVLAPLLAARAKAGLGKAADAAATATKPVVACAPAPHSAVPTMAPSQKPAPASSSELARIIREELQKALRG